MEELLKIFLENHLDKHTYPMVAELSKNVLSVNQREIRSGILLSIEGVKLEKNMTFTLENRENKDYSHLIDMSEILDCSEEMFKNYLEEFKATEKSNWIFISIE